MQGLRKCFATTSDRIKASSFVLYFACLTGKRFLPNLPDPIHRNITLNFVVLIAHILSLKDVIVRSVLILDPVNGMG